VRPSRNPSFFRALISAAPCEASRIVYERPSLESKNVQYKAVLEWGVPDWTGLQRLREISQPMLILQGDTDIMIPTAASHTLAGLIPNAKVRIYPDAHTARSSNTRRNGQEDRGLPVRLNQQHGASAGASLVTGAPATAEPVPMAAPSPTITMSQSRASLSMIRQTQHPGAYSPASSSGMRRPQARPGANLMDSLRRPLTLPSVRRARPRRRSGNWEYSPGTRRSWRRTSRVPGATQYTGARLGRRRDGGWAYGR